MNWGDKFTCVTMECQNQYRELHPLHRSLMTTLGPWQKCDVCNIPTTYWLGWDSKADPRLVKKELIKERSADIKRLQKSLVRAKERLAKTRLLKP